MVGKTGLDVIEYFLTVHISLNSSCRSTTDSECILKPLTTVEETIGIITSYSLDYKGVGSLSTCMENGASNYTYAQRPTFLITDLDPTLKYCLAAAASTSVGVGNYSELVTVECKCTYL